MSNDNTVAMLLMILQNATERPLKKPLPLSSVFEASATAATNDVGRRSLTGVSGMQIVPQ
jgi:hypothetical protein